MESWIIHKEAIVRTEEKGASKDRVESMQKKFDVSNIYISQLIIRAVTLYYHKAAIQ